MKTKYIVLITLLISIFTSCKNAEELHDVIYFTGTETSPAVSYTINGPAELGVTVTSSCLAPTDQKISIKANPEMVTTYNSEYKKNYKTIPEENYKLSQNEIILEAGKNVSEQLILSLLSTEGFEEGATYCMPLTITNVEGGLEILESSRTIYVVLQQQIITQAADLKGFASASPGFENDASLESVPCVSMEARLLAKGFASYNPYISTVMGLEENFLLRFGDVNIKPNQIQLSGGGFPVTSKTEFEINKWYHVAVVYDGNTIKLYVNGELDGQTDAPRGPINLCGKGNNIFYIGESCNGRKFNGVISEVRVWKKALNQTEIQNNMCYITPDNYKDMIAYWRFNDGADAEVIKDWTGNGWDLSLSGSVNWVEGVKCPE